MRECESLCENVREFKRVFWQELEGESVRKRKRNRGQELERESSVFDGTRRLNARE